MDRAPRVDQLPHVEDQKTNNKKNMRKIGHYSYNMLGGPDSTNEEKFAAACLHRSRFHRDDPAPSEYLDLPTTFDQVRMIIKPKPREYTIGSMLDAALDINLGKGLAQRRLNMIGESEGIACVANTPARFRRLRQSAMLVSSLGDIKKHRLLAKKGRAAISASKQAGKRAAAALEAPIRALLEREDILPWGPKKKITITIPVLKTYLTKHKLLKLLPKVFTRTRAHTAHKHTHHVFTDSTHS